MGYHTEEFKKGKEISLDKVKEIEVNILKEFIAFCEQNNLRYYLVGGTLIGAVRNQGFVSWDDDIDVVMPRPDFDKFHSLCNGNIQHYEVRSIHYTPEIHCRGLIRIVDKNYMTQLKVDPLYLPPWIDVFSLEGLPESLDECSQYYNKTKIWKILSKFSRVDLRLTKSKIKRFIKAILFYPLRKIGPIYFNKKLIKIALEYDFDKSEYVGVVTTGLGIRERMPKYYYIGKNKKLPFEGMMVSVPGYYDRYLTDFYGDYLKLPSQKSRKTHIVKAWEVMK